MANVDEEGEAYATAGLSYSPSAARGGPTSKRGYPLPVS